MNDNNKRNILKKTAFWAAILGGSGVVLGAFGAHALKAGLEGRNMVQTWDTAVKYQLVHGVALLALAAWETAWECVRGVGGGAVREMGRKLLGGGSGSVFGIALCTGAGRAGLAGAGDAVGWPGVASRGLGARGGGGRPGNDFVASRVILRMRVVERRRHSASLPGMRANGSGRKGT